MDAEGKKWNISLLQRCVGLSLRGIRRHNGRYDREGVGGELVRVVRRHEFFLLKEDRNSRGRKMVIVTGVFRVGVTRSVSSLDVTATMVGRSAWDNDGFFEATVERVASTFVTGGVHGTLTVVTGGIESVSDVTEFAHTVVGFGEGTLEDVCFVISCNVRGLHHNGAF